jgi:hypothetical protein
MTSECPGPGASAKVDFSRARARNRAIYGRGTCAEKDQQGGALALVK